MTKITRTDYETVEKEVEITVCDCCDMETEDTVQLQLHPKGSRELRHEVVEVSEDPEFEYENMSLEPGSEIRQPFVTPPENVKWGLKRKEFAELTKAEETFDVCVECLRDVLGADVPEDYESAEVKSDGLEVSVKAYNPIYHVPSEETMSRLIDLMMVALLIAVMIWADAALF